MYRNIDGIRYEHYNSWESQFDADKKEAKRLGLKYRVINGEFFRQVQAYVMVTNEFDFPLYIAPNTTITNKKEDAEVWSYADTLSAKLAYHKAITGYNDLRFELL